MLFDDDLLLISASSLSKLLHQKGTANDPHEAGTDSPNGIAVLESNPFVLSKTRRGTRQQSPNNSQSIVGDYNCSGKPNRDLT